MKFLVFFSIVSLPSLLFAQVTISGKVSDKKGPLQGVSVSIKDSYDGALTDSLGKFSFTTSEKGEKTLVVSFIGYKPYEQKITIGKDKFDFDIILKEEITELKAVVVTAGTFEASDKKRAGVVLNSIDIVTTASANADVTQAMKTLPGAQQVGEQEGLFVRGGSAEETKIYIDGTLVNKFYYSSSPNIAGYGRFSPFLFKGTVFTTGGYSALYGQALSAALILESIDLPEKTQATAGITVLSLNAGYQKLNKKKTASWGFDYNYTNLGLAFTVIKQKQDYFNFPATHDGYVNFRIKTSKTGMLKYYSNYSFGIFGFREPSIDSVGYLNLFKDKNAYVYQNLAWKENLGPHWRMNTGVSYTYNNDQVETRLQDASHNDVYFFKNFNANPIGNYFNAKMVFERKLPALSAIRFGGEYNYSNDRAKITDFNGNFYNNKITQSIAAVFAEGDAYITNNLALKLGTRLEHSSLIEKTDIAPRISLAYKTSKTSQASLAYGIFYQAPETKYLPTPSLDFLKATHYIAQYLIQTNARVFRAEAFYKKYESLLKTTTTTGRDLALNNNGYGDAKGFEIFWRDKKTLKYLDYWISYSYLDTKRDYLNFPYATTPNFAARHTASFVVKQFILPIKTGFNLSYTYASSRPYYNIQYDGSKYYFADKGKVPDYNNVSFSVNYIPNVTKTNPKSFIVYVLSINNILNIKQTYGYQYSYNGLRKEAIVPPSRMFVFFGIFMSFGVDRTQDAINGNL